MLLLSTKRKKHRCMFKRIIHLFLSLFLSRGSSEEALGGLATSDGSHQPPKFRKVYIEVRSIQVSDVIAPFRLLPVAICRLFLGFRQKILPCPHLFEVLFSHMAETIVVIYLLEGKLSRHSGLHRFRTCAPNR